MDPFLRSYLKSLTKQNLALNSSNTQHSSFTPNQGVELSQHTLATIKTKEPNQTRELARGNPQVWKNGLTMKTPALNNFTQQHIEKWDYLI